MIVHNCSTQYNTEQFDNLPSYPPDNITDQMLTIGGKGTKYCVDLLRVWMDV